MAKWTYEDALMGKCEPHLIGTEALTGEFLPANNNQTPPKSGPKDTVDIYLDVFHTIGGREELAKFAKNNPGKFYDQLLRLLISMEAPKQTMNVAISIERSSDQELMSMSSQDLKRLLTKSLPD